MKKEIARVIKLFISNKKDKIKKDKIFLDKKGVLEDKFYDKDINRSVLITNLNSYNMISKNNIKVEYGILGENILVDFDIYKLDLVSKIQIGTCTLQISQNCTICEHLSIIDERLPKLLKENRGIFFKVIESGSININDKIFIL